MSISIKSLERLKEKKRGNRRRRRRRRDSIDHDDN